VWRLLSILTILVAVALCMATVANAQTSTPVPRPEASAQIHSSNGDSVGTATLTQTSDQVLISIAFQNRTALVGTHAIQIHGVGQCNTPNFDAAGPIFNPTNRQHGLLNPNGPMVGDLPNMVIGTAGVAVYNLAAPLATIVPGPNSILGGNGTSLVIFSQGDDDKTQPEGNAGQRIACGVIISGPPPSTSSLASLDLSTAIIVGLLGGLLIIGGVLLRRTR
jgi:Cu-Zn family superoxide dismutase